MQKKGLLTAVFFIYFLWICLSARFAAAKESVPSLFVFGDSLIDVGNNNYLPFSVAKGNYPHNGIDFPKKEPTGRLCNGKNAADLLAEKLSLPLPPPYLSLKGQRKNSAILTGVSFASSAAGIFDVAGKIFGERIRLSQQIQDYISIREELVNKLQSSAAQNHLSKSIFMFVIGSNDLEDYMTSSKLQKTINPQQYTKLMATRFEEQLKRLYDYDARKLVVLGIGQIGCKPSERAKNSTHGCDEVANLLCTMFNEALRTMLEQLRQELHGSLSYSYFDSYKAMQDVVADPTAHGFTNVTSACCGSGKLNADLPCFPISNLCPNRTQYFFWDMFGHLTEASSQVLVDLMFNGSSRYSSPLNVQQLASI